MALAFPSSPTVGQLYPSPPIAGTPVWKWDGSEWVIASGNGTATLNQFEYTGLTTCTGADNNGATLAYQVGFIEVFVNGLKLNKGDFTATDGTSVIIGATVGSTDLVTILAFSAVSVTNTLAPSNNLSDVANAATARANLQVAKDASVAKAWAYVTFSGATPTLVAGYNISSVSLASTGNLVFNFTTPFASTAYACSYDVEPSGAGTATQQHFTSARTTSSATVRMFESGALANPSEVSFACFGAQ